MPVPVLASSRGVGAGVVSVGVPRLLDGVPEGVGDPDGCSLGVTLGVAEGDCESLGVSLGESEGVAVGVPDGVSELSEGEGVSLGDSESDGTGVALEPLGQGVGVSEWCAEALVAEPMTIASARAGTAVQRAVFTWFLHLV